jgi:hypothetical protein
MKLKLLLTSAAILMINVSLYADEALPKKTVSIVYIEGKTPDHLFVNSLNHFKKLITTGEIISTQFSTANIFGDVIDFQTPTEGISASMHARKNVSQKIQQQIGESNSTYSGRFTMLSRNIFFGDKSLAFAINPYRGCYSHPYLAKGLENAGYTVVDSTAQSPDIKITISVDTCLCENEYKEHVAKYTALNVTAQKQPSNSTNNTGNDLMSTGSTMHLGSPTSDGVGLAVAGVGLALNMVSWLASDSPKERDVIRYHAKFEAKGKESVEYYPIVITQDNHAIGEAINMSAYKEAENNLYSGFLAWEKDDKAFIKTLPNYTLEKNLAKATQMMVNSNR